MANNMRAKTLIASIKATGLQIDQITSRDDLAQKLATLKTLTADANKCDYTLLDHVKFAWKVINPVNPRIVEPDMGYPDDAGDLAVWAFAKRFPFLPDAEQNDAGYLRYITSGQFSFSEKDWGEYATGNPTLDTEGNVKETRNSEFFIKRHLSTGSDAPVARWRRAAARTREILAHYIQDTYIKMDFLSGSFKSWKELEEKYKMYIQFNDVEEDYQRTVVGFREIRKVMNGTQNPRQKFGAIQTILRPYLCYDDGDVENSVWGTGDELYRKTGPEDFSPTLNELIKWLASWSLTDKEYEDAENEFFKDFKTLKPETLSQNRHKFLEIISKKVKKGGSRVSAVKSAEAETAPGVGEIEDLDDEDFENYVAEFFADDGPTGQILAIRERRNLNNKGFRRKSNKNFSRFKNLAGKFNRAQENGGAQGGGGRGRGAGGNRGFKRAPFVPKGRSMDNSVCLDCTNKNPPKFHSIANCPDRRVRQVRESEEIQDTAETEAFRQVWNEDNHDI